MDDNTDQKTTAHTVQAWEHVTPAPRRLLSQAHKLLSLLVLFAAFFLAQYDRFILSYFQLSITNDLQISSSQYALLSGYATGISYAVLAVPLAYLADWSHSRIWTLTASIIWWSLCMVFQGLSHTYWQLVCARVGMGIGQSAAEALSVSIISDLMGPRKYVTTGEGVLYIGIYIGEAISGQISTAFRKTGTSWRWAMNGVGIFGIGVGIVLRLVLWKEPQRRHAIVASLQSAGPQPGQGLKSKSLGQTVKYIAQMHSFWLFVLSAGVRTLSGVVFGYYMPGYLQLLYPDTENIMSIYGIIVGAVGSTAAFAGGAVTSLFWHRTKLVPLYLVSVGGILSSIFVLLMIFSKTISNDSESNGTKLLYGVMAGAYITAELWLGPINGLLVLMVPPEFKTFAFSIYSSLVVLIYSSGPEIVGLALRGVNPSSGHYVNAVRVILAAIIPGGYILSSLGFLACIPLIKKDLRPQCLIVDEKVSFVKKVGLTCGFAVIVVMVTILFVLNLVYKA